MQSGALNLPIFFGSGNQMVNKSWNLLPRVSLLYFFLFGLVTQGRQRSRQVWDSTRHRATRSNDSTRSVIEALAIAVN